MRKRDTTVPRGGLFPVAEAALQLSLSSDHIYELIRNRKFKSIGLAVEQSDWIWLSQKPAPGSSRKAVASEKSDLLSYSSSSIKPRNSHLYHILALAHFEPYGRLVGQSRGVLPSGMTVTN